MSYHETQYPDLLGGVSQQSPTERAPNALSEQINMVSDPVLGLRRRPPFEFVTHLEQVYNSSAIEQRAVFLRSRLASREVLIMFEKGVGLPTLFDADTGEVIPRGPVQDIPQDVPDHLVSGALADWSEGNPYRVVALNDALYVFNLARFPSEEDDLARIQAGLSPETNGYFYVSRGAFNTTYQVEVRDRGTGSTIEATYTTPDGTATSDSEDATPKAIAQGLMADFIAKYNGETWVTFPSSPGDLAAQWVTGDIEVYSSLDNSLIRTSGRGTVRVATELPPELPNALNGLRMGVGTGNTKVYYQYTLSSGVWVESAAHNAQKRIERMGVVITLDGSAWTAEMLESKTRPAGDAESNPTFRFETKGITGVGSYRGRLVLLAGDYVCMSAANDPTAWYRSSVVELLDNDPIEIAESASKASPYTYAAGFAGGLLVTAETHQAFIPGGVDVTPSTTILSTISEYSQRDNVAPEIMGSAVLLPFNRNDTGASDGLYYAAFQNSEQPVLIANDLSQAVPNYLGRIRNMQLSTSAGMLVLSDYTNRISVFQFTSEEEDSSLAAWHSWALPPASTVQALYFRGGTLYAVVGVVREGESPRIDYVLLKAEVSNGLEPVHYLDFAFTDSLNDESSPTAPTDYPTDIATGVEYRWFATDGDFEGLGGSADFNTLAFTDGTAKTGDFWYGVPYESSASPSPPIIRDRSEYALRRERVNLVKFRAHVENTGKMQADVFDRVHTFTVPDLSPVGLYMPEGVGSGALSGDGYVTIPCRTDAQYTQLTLRTDDFYDMNIKAVEYGFKVQPKHRRA